VSKRGYDKRARSQTRRPTPHQRTSAQQQASPILAAAAAAALVVMVVVVVMVVAATYQAYQGRAGGTDP